MKRSEWAGACALVLSLWPSQPWPDSTIEAGYRLCADTPIEAVIRGIHRLAKEGREYPPPPSKVYEYAQAELPNVRLALPAENELSPEEEARQRANFLRALEIIRERPIGKAMVDA